MQRTDIVAMVVGTTMGMGGAFLICTAGRALTLHLLTPCTNLRQQAPTTARRSALQASWPDSLETRLTSWQVLDFGPERVTRVNKMLTPAR
jgi:hypothetical protein